MPLKLSSPVIEIPRIGPAKAKFLQKLGITHVRDFLYTFPRRYDDFSNITAIKDLKVGQKMTVRGKVKSVKNSWGFYGRRRMLRIFVDIKDETGVLNVTWYNLQFLAKQLWNGREILVAGTIEAGPKMRSPVLEFVDKDADPTHTARITPVYPETYGVTSRFLRYQVKSLLPLISALPEYLPAEIIDRYTLMDIHGAIRTVHFPDSSFRLEKAQSRLRFDELFFLQLAALVRRREWQRGHAIPIAASKKELGQLIKALPFRLTGAQSTALDEIIHDLAQARPMNRLLQGDVGSGKSALALLTAQVALAAGRKVMYLAPTEILARQQAQHFSGVMSQARVSLLIGAVPVREKIIIKKRLLAAEPICVIGTHALLQEDVQGKNVALAIIDEQHRFGVAQRKALLNLGEETIPHLLSMTATPIPRTLNLTVYGDLDVSVLDELPPGRQPIKTKIVVGGEKEKAIIHVLEELHAGRQGYVIAPLIEESETIEAKSAKKAYAEIQHLFPGVAVGLLHGQMSSEEKEVAMRNFAAGAIQLLVATAVVEVGVNVPNATIMIIEGAERFGLSQLHQFRGRIGRGKQQSYCYLFPSSADYVDSERLKILERTTDGFIIAEEDLQLRGPGEVYGVAQSGFGDLKVASLLDYPTIKAARAEAQKILEKDPELEKYPILRAKVAQKNMLAHFE